MRGKWVAGMFVVASAAAMLAAALAGARPSSLATAAAPSGRIAFERSQGTRGEIYVMNGDGSDAKSLAHGRQPAFSHDGTEIAFVRVHGSGQIYVMNADGSGQRRLTNDQHGDSEPALSPEG